MIAHDYKHLAQPKPIRQPTSQSDFAAGLGLVFLIVALSVLILTVGA